MTTTTYGYRNPDTGDLAKGSNGWYASYNFNVTRWDSHNHDGSNSALLAPSSITPYTSTILAVNWSASGTGYKQTITVPAGITEINNYIVDFIFTAPAGVLSERAHLNYKRLSATTYEVYCNDNTAAFTAVYL